MLVPCPQRAGIIFLQKNISKYYDFDISSEFLSNSGNILFKSVNIDLYKSWDFKYSLFLLIIFNILDTRVGSINEEEFVIS